MLTVFFAPVTIPVALNKKSAQKQKEQITTASRKPLFNQNNNPQTKTKTSKKLRLQLTKMVGCF